MDWYEDYRKKTMKKTIEKSEINETLINLIVKLDNNSKFYLNHEKMKMDLDNMVMIILERNSHCEKNLCIECGEDMGINNPRQLCGKTYCRNPPNKECCNNCNNILEDNEKINCNRIECIRDRCHC